MNDHDADIEQQLLHRELLSDLGTEALRSREIEPLLQEACRIVAAGMGTRFCKVLEFRPQRSDLLVRAGVGWHDGVVGHATLGAEDASPAGHALRTCAPVISNDLSAEDRFRTPPLLLEHGIVRAINVIIRGDGKPYGVLEVDSRRPGEFLTGDIAFLQAAANLLGVAIERGRREAELQAALAAHELLLREADHRIKNSLQLVVSLLSMQRSRLPEGETTAALEGAISRIGAVAEAHRALHQSRDLRNVEFGRMLADICAHTSTLNPRVETACRVEGEVELDAERAIPLSLIVSELLTNASRHAYPEGEHGKVEVEAAVDAGWLRVSIVDRGIGIDPGRPRSGTLGATIVQALARQIGAAVESVSTPGEGTAITVRLRLAEGPP